MVICVYLLNVLALCAALYGSVWPLRGSRCYARVIVALLAFHKMCVHVRAYLCVTEQCVSVGVRTLFLV